MGQSIMEAIPTVSAQPRKHKKIIDNVEKGLPKRQPLCYGYVFASPSGIYEKMLCTAQVRTQKQHTENCKRYGYTVKSNRDCNTQYKHKERDR